MQSIGVIGGGVLGRAIARGFIEHAEIKVYDVVPERATHTLAEAATCDIVLVCLPTPANADGTCDTTFIDDFLDWAKRERWWSDDACYVIRSTVPVGYTLRQAQRERFKLPLFHSPEFLTARCALTDFQIPARNIIGNPTIFSDAQEDQEPEWSVSQSLSWKYGLREIEGLYERRFPGVPVHIMPSNGSELVKLFCNTFFAAKVTLFNLAAEMAKAAGVEWEDVRGAILSDGRIAHAHTLVAEQPIGFGGACLVAGTVLRTPHGEIAIEDVEPGVEVEDRSGYVEVTAAATRLVDKTVTIRARGRSLTGSEDHRHMVFDGISLREAALGSIRPCELVFIPQPPDIERSPVFVGPRPSNKCKVWNEQIDWSQDLAWLVGIWLAEGFKSRDPRKNTARVHWCHGEHEEYLADEVCRIIASLGMHPQKYLKVGEGTFGTSRCWSVRTDSLWFYQFLNTIGVGDYCDGKRAPDVDAETGRSIVGGWLDGDGSRSDGTISGHSESVAMIRDLDRLIRRNGICPQISRCGRKLSVSMRDDVDAMCEWTKRLRPEQNRFVRPNRYASTRMRRHHGGWLVEVQSVEAETLQTEVFAIETASGTYVANGMLTHNCLPKDAADLFHCATALGVDAEIIRAVLDRNERLRRPYDPDLAKIALPPR